MRSIQLCLACLLATAAVVTAQDKPATSAPQANALSTFDKIAYARVKGMLLRSAEKMPEENYSFKPTPEVRSYGQILGHVADAQYMFCSVALGEKNPEPKIEQTKTSKADLTTALKDAVAYCDKAYDSMTDANAVQMVSLFGNEMPKGGVLVINLMHNMEHYGNLVTYMRMKGIVPPSSEQSSQPQQPKK